LQSLIDAGGLSLKKLGQTRTLIFNERLDAAVCALFMILVTTILVDSVRVWVGILRGTRERTTTETPFVPSTLRPEEV
jgi:carbon starvation protein